jgi:hypothetical protein
MKHLPLISALILSSCLRSAGVPPYQQEEDRSIVFPMFFGVKGAKIDEQGGVFEMDGTVLQALTVVNLDFLSLSSLPKGCWSGPEGHRYGLIRQGDIIFIDISADFINCWHEFMPMDYGAVYAIRSGRILRRVFSADPDYPNPLRESDAGVSGVSDDRDSGPDDMDSPDIMLRAVQSSSHIAIPLSWLDGGFPRSRLQAAPDGGVQSDGGLPDGGLPVVFPELFGVEGTAIGEQGKLCRMEGITLRALLTAIEDFRLTSAQGHSCGSVPEEQFYRIFDQGEIIFIEITANTSNCKPGSLMMAHGVKYAISPEGRILRRISSGGPDDVPALKPSDAGVAGDGGPWPDGGLPSDGGVIPAPPP